MGDSQNDVTRHMSVAITDKHILYYSQYALYIIINYYVRDFKNAPDLMPPNSAEFRIVISSDRKPRPEHNDCFNTPRRQKKYLF